MKVAIILLDYQRHDYTARVVAHNLDPLMQMENTPVVFKIDRLGIAAALNEGIDKAKEIGAEAIVTMANDILLPPGWFYSMVSALKAIPDTGMCGIHTVEGIDAPEVINGVTIHRSFTAFGNVMIPMKVIDKIGYFQTEFDPYGMQDADFAFRLIRTGHINYYLHNLKGEHIGHDVGNGTEYRAMKDAGLNKAGDTWGRLTKHYDDTNNYTVFMKEYP